MHPHAHVAVHTGYLIEAWRTHCSTHIESLPHKDLRKIFPVLHNHRHGERLAVLDIKDVASLSLAVQSLAAVDYGWNHSVYAVKITVPKPDVPWTAPEPFAHAPDHNYGVAPEDYLTLPLQQIVDLSYPFADLAAVPSSAPSRGRSVQRLQLQLAICCILPASEAFPVPPFASGRCSGSS
ncbi:hypothetical protein D1872_202430 [compost metagenome]